MFQSRIRFDEQRKILLRCTSAVLAVALNCPNTKLSLPSQSWQETTFPWLELLRKFKANLPKRWNHAQKRKCTLGACAPGSCSDYQAKTSNFCTFNLDIVEETPCEKKSFAAVDPRERFRHVRQMVFFLFQALSVVTKAAIAVTAMFILTFSWIFWYVFNSDNLQNFNQGGLEITWVEAMRKHLVLIFSLFLSQVNFFFRNYTPGVLFGWFEIGAPIQVRVFKDQIGAVLRGLLPNKCWKHADVLCLALWVMKSSIVPLFHSVNPMNKVGTMLSSLTKRSKKHLHASVTDSMWGQSMPSWRLVRH